MGYINNCRTVNCGVIVNIGLDYVKSVEVLSHKFHNPHCDIVCYYFIDEKTGSKVEVTVCKDLEYTGYASNGAYSSGVYFFHRKDDLQHYTSRRYELKDVPKKYREIVKDLYRAHLMIDFNQF